ncbi:MAG TPA: hypothetical protein VM223_00205 [Planctomycetota bacterium]|nr:hypothetical protein [Planctomycetota bacterium]
MSDNRCGHCNEELTRDEINGHRTIGVLRRNRPALCFTCIHDELDNVRVLRGQVAQRDAELARLRRQLEQLTGYMNEARELARSVPVAVGLDTPHIPAIVRRLVDFAWEMVRGEAGAESAAQKELARHRAIVEPLNRLRADEGSFLTIYHDNAGYIGPTSLVYVHGPWGGSWDNRRFEGDSLAAALAAAVTAMQTAEAAKEKAQ